jgi:hypothetical protein
VTLIEKLPRLIELYKIIKDEKGVFADKIENVIVETLSKTVRYDVEQQHALLHEFSDRAGMWAGDDRRLILQNKVAGQA